MSLAIQKLASLLAVDEQALAELELTMARLTGRRGVIEQLIAENEQAIAETLTRIDSDHREADHVRGALRKAIFSQEQELLKTIAGVPGKDEFEKAAALAKQIAKADDQGMFLKKEHIARILRVRPPQNLMRYLGYTDIEKLIVKEDLTECFSALRFIESNEWMHETFAKAYAEIAPADFEERPIEIRVLGSKWRKVSEAFAAKKHHNVSHLKEFGVIFINPLKENIPGKFLRDFSLLFHYFHEIRFYSKLFARYFKERDFTARFTSLLRGDVKEVSSANAGDWLIVQRYLIKENPDDPRLRMPRVNPESLHWARAERDLATCAAGVGCAGLALWAGLDWVGDFFSARGGRTEEFISFDLEDNAMSFVSFMEGRHEFFTYHQREALWTKLFSEYAGGEAALEKLLTENFEKGAIVF